jgi:single-stranded DNA-binding protein
MADGVENSVSVAASGSDQQKEGLLMVSQLYLTGRLNGEPEIAESRKGKPYARILLETEQIRPTPNGPQSETITLPIILFSRQAEAIRAARKGDQITLGCHFNGTRYETPDGGVVKHGLQLIADSVLREMEVAQ